MEAEGLTMQVTAPLAGRIQPMPNRDIIETGNWAGYLFRPLRLPSRETVIASLAAAGGAMLSRDVGGGWHLPTAAEVAARAEETVLNLPKSLWAASPDHIYHWWHANDDMKAPIRFYLGGDTLFVGSDHRLADGARMGPLVTTPFRGSKSSYSPQQSSAHRSDSYRAAIWTTFVRHPKRAAALLREHPRDTLRMFSAVIADIFRPQRPLVVGPPARWARPPAHLLRRMSGPVLAEYLRWSKSSGVSGSVSMAALVRAAFAKRGCHFDDRVSLPVDLRRYLPDSFVISGNFVQDVTFELGPGADLGEVSSGLRKLINSGWPLVRYGPQLRSAARNYVHPSKAIPPVRSSRHLLINNFGRIPWMELLPWNNSALERTVATFTGGLLGPDDVILTCYTVFDDMWINLSFGQSGLDHALASDALNEMVTAPLALLAIR